MGSVLWIGSGGLLSVGVCANFVVGGSASSELHLYLFSICQHLISCK